MRRLLVFLCLAPVVVWLLSLLIFSTSWGTGLVASRLEKKIGLDCEIESLGWTPWSGFFLKGLVLTAPDDFQSCGEVVRVAEVVVDPGWQHLMKKKLAVDQLQVGGVSVNLPVELVKHLAQKNQGGMIHIPHQQVNEGGELAVVEEPSERLESPKVAENGTPAESVKEGEVVEGHSSVQPVEAPKPKISHTPRMAISLGDVSLRVYSLRQPELEMKADAVAADFMLGGAPEKGELKIAEVSLGQEILLEDISWPLEWDGELLNLPEQLIEVKEVKVALSGAMRPVRGLPYGVQANLPEQKVSMVNILGSQFPIEIEKIAARQSLQGSLTNPRLVYGSSQAFFRDVVYQDSNDGTEVRFETGQAFFQLSPAGLVTPDFRWIGEEDAILGNGFLTAAGEGAMVVRLVGSAERAEGYERRAQAWREGFSLQMQPLETPDRWFSDVRVDLGAGGVTVSLEREETSPKILP